MCLDLAALDGRIYAVERELEELKKRLDDLIKWIEPDALCDAAMDHPSPELPLLKTGSI